MSEFLVPGSPEWLATVTASKIPSILGISRFKSQYTLWHEMAGLLAPAPVGAEQQDDFDYGHAAELAAAEYWKIKNPGWRLSRGEVQLTRDDLPFPNAATIDRRAVRGRGRRIVEVKTARDLADWGDDGTGEVPIDYAAQVIWQQLISRWHGTASLVLWPQYGKPKIYPIEWDAGLADDILAQAHAWVDSLAMGIPPELDNSISCYETVRALHPDIDGSDAPIDVDLAADYLTADRDAKDAEKRARGLKTRLLDAMGNARYAKCGDIKIADRRPNGHGGVSLYAATKTDPTTLTEGHAA